MTAQPGLYRGNEFNRIDWLHQIVIRANIHTGADVTTFTPAREENKRQVSGPRFSAQRFQNAMPVHFWHRDITHDEIRVFFPGKLDPFAAIPRFDHRKTFEAQQSGKLLPEFCFIIDNQNALHGGNAERRLSRSKETNMVWFTILLPDAFIQISTRDIRLLAKAGGAWVNRPISGRPIPLRAIFWQHGPFKFQSS